ncbi:MAG: hypothetical protein ACFB10_09720 [Salibacteraceae bacterium]
MRKYFKRMLTDNGWLILERKYLKIRNKVNALELKLGSRSTGKPTD